MKRINFTTAKLVKEAGFDKQSDCAIYWKDGVLDREEKYIFYSDNAFPACFQAEIQEWLRNEHNIHINLKSEYVGEYQYRYEVWFLECPLGIIGTKSTYEDALEEGLVQALKIVIDAKSNM